MKVLTILGTRPEIIRLSRIIPLLDGLCDQRIIHTGQNYDPNLDEVFFRDLGVRRPDHHLGARGSLGSQLGAIIDGVESAIREFRPDRFLVLGDTNSSLGAIAAKRMGVPVFHMEAGNRCHDDRVPEEVNRRIIDHSSDILLPYTERSRQNLLQEGIPGKRILVTGNPIREVMDHYWKHVEESQILSELGLEAGGYFLVTMHRAENVDVPERLNDLVVGLRRLGSRWKMPVVVSTHPRTRQRLQAAGSTESGTDVRFLEPFGFFDFLSLQRHAFCVVSDSGTVQEESCILRVPNVTIRDTTERPETLECGSNMLAGCDPDRMSLCVQIATTGGRIWDPPHEYMATDVSRVIARILLGHHDAAHPPRI